MKYKAYVTACRYCHNWGPKSGCRKCVGTRPGRLIKKLAIETFFFFRRVRKEADYLLNRCEPGDPCGAQDGCNE